MTKKWKVVIGVTDVALSVAWFPYHGWALAYAWNVLIVPVFGAGPMTWVHGGSASLVATLLLWSPTLHLPNEAAKKALGEDTSAIVLAVLKIIAPPFAVLGAWIAAALFV